MQEISEHELTCTISELFEAISNLEYHEFINDVEFFQNEKIQIADAEGFTPIRGMIKKQAECVHLVLENGEIVKCAKKHVLFTVNGDEVFAGELSVGNLIKTNTGSIAITAVIDGGVNDVFDIEVMNDSHSYVTTNGVIHHNTSITAAISHFYGTKGYKIITIVPSGDLVSQTKEWYELLQLDVGEYSGDNKDLEHTHIVATWQALQYNAAILRDFDVLIWDECFSGDTTVLMGDLTWKKISEIVVGDEVVSMNAEGNFEIKQVMAHHMNLPKHSGKMLKLHLDNGVCLEVTENHEFFTVLHGKVKAKDLTSEHEIHEFSINKLKIHGDKTHAEER